MFCLSTRHGRVIAVQRTASLPLAYARPSTSLLPRKRTQDMDHRDTPGGDDSKNTTPPPRRSPAIPSPPAPIRPRQAGGALGQQPPYFAPEAERDPRRPLPG